MTMKEQYLKYARRKRGVLAGLTLAVFIMAIFALNAGAAKLNPYEVLRAFLGQGAPVSNIVIWKIRLPRLLAAIIAGAGLSVSGCVMQSNLRNPLASPSTLGISSAAAFGANVAIILLGAGSVQSTSTDAVLISNPYIVSISAFFWAMTAAVIVLALSRSRGFSPEAMVLAGVALSSLFSAGTILIQYFAEDVQVAAVVFWSFGDLGRAAWNEVGILSLLTVLSLAYFMYKRWDYNALDSGEDSAKSLGVRVENVRMMGLLVSCTITAAAVSFLGIIGFVGLVGPQIMRRLIGSDHRFLIPGSALAGAILLLCSDTLARTIVSPVVLPVGAITSFFGAPLFMYLLVRGYGRV